MSMTSCGLNARRAVAVVDDKEDLLLRRVGCGAIWRGVLARAVRCRYDWLTRMLGQYYVEQIYGWRSLNLVIGGRERMGAKALHLARVHEATKMLRAAWESRNVYTRHASVRRKRARWRRRMRREARAWVMVLRALRARGPLNRRGGSK